LSDILDHGARPFGGGIEERIKELVTRFPEAESELVDLLQSRAASRAVSKLIKARQPILDRLLDLSDAHEARERLGKDA
jgi:hypothetical protein